MTSKLSEAVSVFEDAYNREWHRSAPDRSVSGSLHAANAAGIEAVIAHLQGEAVPVTYGIRVKGNPAIVGVLPVPLKDFPIKNPEWDARYEEVPLYLHPQPAELSERQELDFYREHIGNDLDNLLIGEGVLQVTHEGGYEACWKNTMDAVERLAATGKQQVGGPEIEFQARLMDVKTDLPTENWHHSPTYEENPGRGTHYWVQYRKRYIYYAPPAQGIDLGQLRELAQGWVNHAARGVPIDAADGDSLALSVYDDCGSELLALIDGRDAGTGVE